MEKSFWGRIKNGNKQNPNFGTRHSNSIFGDNEIPHYMYSHYHAVVEFDVEKLTFTYDIRYTYDMNYLYRDVKEDKNSPYLKDLKHAEALIAKHGAPTEVKITTAQCREY
ncbi:MAG: hypothetical protein ACLGGX_00280 [Bdellovibrionia bacterium]